MATTAALTTSRLAVRRLPILKATASRLRSSSSQRDPGSSDEDLAKWERMYNGYESKENMNINTAGTQSPTVQSSEVRVVTFDLDNTIWKTGAVISSANDALANFLDSKGIKTTIRVEKIMGELFKQNKAKYCPVLAQDHVSGKIDGDFDKVKAPPVLLTQLRKDAIKELLKNEEIEFELELEQFAEEAFDAWTEARHAAIPSNLASSVIEGLEEIRRLQTKDGKNVVVGAITDGNSNPRKVDMLKKYFDFVTNAESVGISKPDRRIYDAAILHIFSDSTLNHVFGTNNSDEIMDKLGPWWIHIGDDFVKDIVAAKDLKMRTIWCRELIKGKLPKKENNAGSQMTEMESRKEMGDKKVKNMIIGADDYLMDSLHTEFADAIVDDFHHVAEVISSWHEEGKETSTLESTFVDLPDYFSIELPAEREEVIESLPKKNINGSKNKYCIDCGQELPLEAKFCSSCGNKQP